MNRAVATGISADDLSGLIAAGSWTWFYGERRDETVLRYFSAEITPKLWQHGRVFGASGELAWWRLTPTLFECRQLSTGVLLASAHWQQVDTVAADGDTEQLLLHGLVDLTEENKVADPVTWSDARIPRYLSYPLPADAPLTPDSRAVLETQRCRTASGQQLQQLVAVRLAEET